MGEQNHSMMFKYATYAAQFGKSHSTIDELKKRAKIFHEKDQMIQEWNAHQMITENSSKNYDG